jgi:YidC/Oxa1 family membrane protein insertase
MSTILKPLVELLHWILMWIHDTLSAAGLSEDWTWGLAIIGITVLVRLIMFPLTWKQYKSSRAMQALAPHIKELQKKHKGDRAALQQETMKLYQEHRVNPFASCLPLVLQLPVFFALYYTIRGTDYLPVEETQALFNASFLWLPKLGEPDPYYILLVVYIVTQLISTELMLTPQTDKTQKMLMRGMPVMFVFFLKGFPSGLFVYWVTTNLWTIGQQLIIRKTMPIVALEAAAGSSGDGGGGKSGKAGPPPKKRGKFMEAMMAAQEQRQTQLEERRKKAQGGGDEVGTAAKKGAGANAAKSGSSKTGGKKGGKRPPPGKGAKAKPKPTPVEPEPDFDEDDDKPPYR